MRAQCHHADALQRPVRMITWHRLFSSQQPQEDAGFYHVPLHVPCGFDAFRKTAAVNVGVIVVPYVLSGFSFAGIRYIVYRFELLPAVCDLPKPAKYRFVIDPARYARVQILIAVLLFCRDVFDGSVSVGRR